MFLPKAFDQRNALWKTAVRREQTRVFNEGNVWKSRAKRKLHKAFGKRSCATSLYKAGLDEQSIMDRTGHRSTAVSTYKTKTNEIEEKVSMTLNPPSEENTVGTRDEKQPPKKIKFDNSVEVHDDTRQGLFDITNGPASRGNVSYNNCHFIYTVTK
ncbi:unnamed protein product [Mytilus coruscus]|uniref:Tyr recombinase domain-containing protein n=1 Tax=Mytilus coruscus TaxID=42192 RepID=A0A6J8A2W6_MYTCO|nr:unnamed protein product [Mytilus coruscus]